jgi:putative MFS transporter
VSSLFAVVETLGTGMMADIIGRKKNLALGFLICGVSLILLGYSANKWQVLVFCILVNIMWNYAMSGLMPLMAETYRTEFRNTGISWATAFGRVEAFCGPIMGGFVQKLGLGYTGVFAFFALPAAVCVLVTVAMVKETKGRGVEAVLAAGKSAG